MDYAQFFTAVGTVGGTAGLVYTVLHNFKTQFRAEFREEMDRVNERFKQQDERINRQEERLFQLAMGKSLKKILAEERIKMDPEQFARSAIHSARQAKTQEAEQ